MAKKWPAKRRVIGKKHARLDGPEKSTGKAKYSYDIHKRGMLHAVILRCPYPHAKIKSIDTLAAEKSPGFKALHVIRRVNDELFYAGAEVLAIAADTEEHAYDAIRLCKVEYDQLPFAVKEAETLANKELQTVGPVLNVAKPQVRQATAFETGVGNAEVTVEGTYGMPIISHQCLEAHGMVAEWDDKGGLTVWASTQAVEGISLVLAGYLNRTHKMEMAGKVKCITHYMGGGFGSKFGPETEGEVCVELALKTKAPVKLMLDRASEVTTAGNRPSAYGKVKIGGKKDGTITFFDADTFGSQGIGAGGTVGPMPYVYPFVSLTKHTAVRMNTGRARAMRAPGHPQSCFFTDCALDDFAAKIGMDPMKVRLKNLPPRLPQAPGDDPRAVGVYEKQIEIAAKLSNWKEKWHPPGKGKGGTIKHGIGMALHTWGGQAQGQPNECTLIIASDGSVTAETSTQDLGTGQRTVTAIVAAEVLGLEPKDITVHIGESPFGRSTGSGGSTTCPSQAPATLQAAFAVRDELFKKIAGKLGGKPEDLEIVLGKVRNKATGREVEWKQACAQLGTEKVRGKGSWTFAESKRKENDGISKLGVGGVQVAEVLVDIETGIVKCTQIVAVQDCGLIINKLACESQVAGGVIMGLNYALYEEIIADRNTGRIVNPDMEFYKLGGINDMPKIIVEMMDMPERGVIGIGEPPTISTHAAIGNAIFNAIGVRVPETPFTADRVLAALAKGGK
jgi:xanthine dehydrogenase YagR molybdenum-binding subunit